MYEAWDSESAFQEALAACDAEPIANIGHIQPHGALVGVSKNGTIDFVSENCATIVGRTPQQMLFRPANEILGDVVAEVQAHAELTERPYRTTIPVAGRPLHAHGYVTGEYTILELEPSLDSSADAVLIQDHIRVITESLRGARTTVEVGELGARAIRALTGFDRVDLYKFHHDWHGEVIAEAVAEDWDHFLGLHFPASDIPPVARELYLRLPLRLIPNIGYEPTKIIGEVGFDATEVKLHTSILRGVSPIHLRYLEPMNVGATLTISIIVDGALWGLFACHHREPRSISPYVRTACELIGSFAALQLGVAEENETLLGTNRAYELASEIQSELARASSLESAASELGDQLLDVLEATGAAVAFDGGVEVVGETPDENTIRVLIEAATERANGANAWSSFEAHRDLSVVHERFPGVLFVPLAAPGEGIVWFRPETTVVRQWAGNPNKPIDYVNGAPRLSPRGSFDLWSESIRGSAKPWSSFEIETAIDIGNAFEQKGGRERLERLSNELEERLEALGRANADLSQFAYVASHDLREPLRMVASYCELLNTRYPDQLDEKGRGFLQHAVNGARRMQSLVEDLLAFSRAERTELLLVECDLNKILEQVCENLHRVIEERGARVEYGELPTVAGSHNEFVQLLQNLIANALKFSESGPVVQIGVVEVDGFWEIRVADNGIGINPAFHDSIFEPFRRLHSRDDYDGNGIGLAMCRRIVEKRNGTIRAESVMGEGSTFIIRWPANLEPQAEMSFV